MSKQLNASSIYELGIWLGFLEGILTSEKTVWKNIRETLQFLSTYKTVSSLEFIGNESQAELLSLAKIYKYSYSRQMTDNDKETLNSLVHNWHGRLAEIQKRWLIRTPKTALDINKLCSGAKSFFEDSKWESLTELERKGLDEAVACLLANNYTASEFMALRSVESVLRRWY